MIPKPIIRVVEATREFVRARHELRRAEERGETNELGIRRMREKIKSRLKALDVATIDLEKQLEEATKRRSRGAAASSWSTVFQHLGTFMTAVQQVRAGDPRAVGTAAGFVGRTVGPRPDVDDDIVEGEIVG